MTVACAQRLLTCGGLVKQRFVMSFMLLMAVLNIYTMRTCLSVAIVQMADSHVHNSTYVDPDRCPAPAGDSISGDSASSATPTRPPEFHWDETVQGVVLSSFYYGYILSHLPGGWLADRFGGKHTLGLGILSTALTTLLTPAAAHLGPYWLIALRIIMGVGEGVTFPAVSVLLAHWVPPAERSRLGSFVFAGAQLGTVAGTAISGLLLSHFYWPVTFYFFGGLGVVWYAVWMALCYSTPEEHPFISEQERDYLHQQISASNHGKPIAPTPWRGILLSLPVWGLAVAQVGHDWGFFTMVTDLPKYMKSVLQVSIGRNGLLSALPYLVMWLCSMLFAAVADWIIARRYWSVLTVRKFFTTLASIIPALGIIGASYAGCDETLTVVLFTVGMGGMGAFYPGMRVNGLDLSKHYAGTVMALVNGLGAVSGMVSPILIGLLTPHSSLLEWRTTFWITFGVLMLSNFIYVLTAQATIQRWDHQPQDEEDAVKKHPSAPPMSMS
ncbi:Putative inorganic phosphate cotransporter [Frankliniella fusca]|uniref:Sialin n=1 Tax=Frankliniella fusca TaxID=407009 RepID=A0AAE1H769_9NEOP|nr:Putative inorganic phosphate cotransporter [Frankliniella fusca]